MYQVVPQSISCGSNNKLATNTTCSVRKINHTTAVYSLELTFRPEICLHNLQVSYMKVNSALL